LQNKQRVYDSQTTQQRMSIYYKLINSAVGGNLRPAWTFDMTRISVFIIQVRVQDRVKTKLDDEQVLR